MRTAVYVRVSPEGQMQAPTIEQQLERLQAHLAARGEELAAEAIFRDEGYSGASLNRPGLDQLQDKVRGAAIERVMVTSPDRLARNYVHQMVLTEEVAQVGCQVEFLERPMSQDPHDQLLLPIRGAVAESERTLSAERMRRGRQMKLRAGFLLPWTRPPSAIAWIQTGRAIRRAYGSNPRREPSSKNCSRVISPNGGPSWGSRSTSCS